MLDKLFKRPEKKPEVKPVPTTTEPQDSAEDALDETGTFMLDINQLKECEDLDDLLKDV